MLRRFFVTFVVCMGGATGAWAQLAEQTGLVGTVTDSGGGVIPGAAVTAVNVGTQDTYETLTNEQGQYNIPNVRIGRYSITIALQGFKTFQVTGLQVAGNQVVRRDAALDVGERTETVTVEAKAVVLATDRAALSQTIDARAVSELPISGRNVWSLASTTPGVLAGNTSDIGFSFRGAGQRSIQNNMTLDGISSSSNLLAMTSMRPIQDAVEEVQVQTGSTSAEYGSFLGVHVNVVTKSGTNDFHGSGYEFFQNESLNARGYFDNRAIPKNPSERNQYGAVLGGPVVIPGLYQGQQPHVLHGRVGGYPAGRTDESDRVGAYRENAAGRLLRSFHPDPEPVYPRALRRQHHPGHNALARLAAAAPVLSVGEPARYRVQLSGPRGGQGRARPGAVPCRSEYRDQDSALVPLQLAGFVRGPLAVGPRDPARVAAARQQELARLVHALAGGEPPQRLPDRLPPDGRGHTELFLGERHRGRRLSPRHPRLRRRRGLREPRDPQLRHQRVQRPGPGGHELAPVRHHVPALGRALLYARVAQPSRRVRCPPDGHVAAVG